MQKIKNIKLFSIITSILVFLSIIIPYLLEIRYLKYCEPYLNQIPIVQYECANRTGEWFYVALLYIITFIIALILISKLISYIIIKLINSLKYKNNSK